MASSSLFLILLSSLARGESAYPVVRPPIVFSPSDLKDNGCGSRWTHFPSYYSRNGVQDTAPVKNLSDCLNHCYNLTNCYAVDFQSNATSSDGCWQHRNPDDLRPSNTFGPDSNFAQFIKDRRCLRKFPLSEAECQLNVDRVTEHSSSGFSLHYYFYRDRKECYGLCLRMIHYNCVGYDFDRKVDRPSGGCYLFFDTGNLSMVVKTPFVDHYVFQKLVCPSTTTAHPTPTVVHSSAAPRESKATTTTTKSTKKPTTTAPSKAKLTPTTTAVTTENAVTSAQEENMTTEMNVSEASELTNATRQRASKTTTISTLAATENAVTSEWNENMTTQSQKKKKSPLIIIIAVVVVIAIIIIVVIVVRSKSKKEEQPKGDEEMNPPKKKSDVQLNKGQIPPSAKTSLSPTGRRKSTSGSRLSISRQSIAPQEIPSEITPLKGKPKGPKLEDNLKRKTSFLRVIPSKTGPSKKTGGKE